MRKTESFDSTFHIPLFTTHIMFTPNPILFQLGPLTIRWYGILIVGGALIAAWVAAREAHRRGQNPNHIWDVFVYALLGGILGGRLYHVFSSPAGGISGPGYYFGVGAWTTISAFGQSIPFPRALAIWEGGLGIYGGIIGGLLVVLYYTWRHRLHLLTFLDFGALGLLVGQAIGRWGNFFNQELYGQPTTLPWGIPIDAQHRLVQYVDLPLETRFHPTFLYESLLNLVVLAILLFMSRRYANKMRPGDVTFGYLIGYGIVRFTIEFFRPDAWTIGPLATAQWIGILFVIVGVVLLLWNHRRVVTYPFILRETAPTKSRQRRRRSRSARA